MSNGTEVNASQSDHVEVDNVEEMLGRLGSYGNIPEVPVANSARSVYFVAPTAQGDGDGSTAGNALAGDYDVISGNGTANVKDVFIFLQGTFNFSGAVGGLAMSIAGVKAFGLGGGLSNISNSHASATAVITVTANTCEVAGFICGEATTTVEGIVIQNVGYCQIHNNYFTNTMENAIHIDAPTSASNGNIIEYNHIYNMTNDGVELSASTIQLTANIIRHNDFFGIGDSAININGDTCDENWAYDNTINNCGTGISIVLGDNNSITDNTIVGCTTSISDTGSDNYWDNKGTIYKNVVNPSSGGGVALSGAGAGAETWSPWLTVVTPTVPFEVVKIEVFLKEKDKYYIEAGISGGDSDIIHHDCRTSGTVITEELSSPSFYPQGTTIASRCKSEQGSGNEATVWIWTHEPR